MSEAAAEVVAYLRSAGLAGDEPIHVEPLGGGISNDVWAITIGHRELVMKQALAKLRVEAEWLSDIERVHREAACQRWLVQALRPGEVPAVVYEDFEQHCYLMDRAPHAAVNWKSELLAGRVDPDAASRAGDLLARIHTAGRTAVGIREQLADKQVFDQLRLDPYLRTIAARHPDLSRHLMPLLEALAASTETIVHGDYSPKNILLDGDHNILLDHEVAHLGEPCFDLGFFFCHLFLKALHVAPARPALWAQIPAAWAAYRAGYPGLEEARWLPYLGAMLLARVDGKSPAEYLRRDELEAVRSLARKLLRSELTDLPAVIENAKESVG